MSGSLQDTWLGHALRFATRSQILQWPEQKNPSRYISKRDWDDDTGSNSDESNEKPHIQQIVIDWVENDSDNPHNWSSLKKAAVSAQICLLTTSVYIGAAIYTLCYTGISEQFHVSQVAAILGLSLFIIGYGIGPMVFCALAEMPTIGRSPVYIGTLLMFVGLQPCVIYAKNIGMLLAFRFLTGLFGSPALALGGATAADLYPPPKLNYAISFWGISAALGPVLGPVCGSFAVQEKGWTWAIWILMWLSGFCLLILICFLPETLGSNILHRRAKRLQSSLRKTDPSKYANTIVKSRSDIEAEKVDSAKEGISILTQTFAIALFEPLVLILNLYVALVYALLYLWFESFPLVFLGIYGFSPGLLGISFIGLLIGVLIALIAYCIYLRLRIEPLYADPKKNHRLKPEINMEVACVGSIFIPASMFLFGWSARTSVHWIVPVIGTALFPLGIFPLFMSVIGYLAAAYPEYIASTLAGNDLMRAGFGAGFPLFAGAMFHKLGVAWGNSLLGFLAMVFVPVPFVLLKYGGKIRKMSKKALQEEVPAAEKKTASDFESVDKV